MEASSTERAKLSEQADYYRARAGEYAQWFYRQGRYDRGEDHTRQWVAEVDQVRAELTKQAPFGETLEFAAGTGLWTEFLAPKSTATTVVDASAEMLALNKSRNSDSEIQFIQSDIFEFEPTQTYDFVFFGFWLSHVPSSRFTDFWNLVRRCVKPSGRIFFVDSLKESQSTAVDHLLPNEDDSETLVRKLNDGREFTIYKLFYQPLELQARLSELGWSMRVNQTNSFFLYGCGSATEPTA